MIRLRCNSCRLVWDEDRSSDDSPIHPSAFLCARCGRCGDPFDQAPTAALPAKEPSK